MKEIRPQMVAQNPDKHVNDVVRMIGKSWEKVDDATKQKLENEYKKDKEVFEKELVKYESQLTPQMKEDLKTARNDRVERRARLAIKNRNKDLGKPKRAPSAFLVFASAERKKNPKTSNETVPTFIKKIGAKWNALNETEKKPFVEVAEKGLAQYKADLEKWEARMIKEGNVDVVRNPIFDTQTPKKAAPTPSKPSTPKSSK